MTEEQKEKKREYNKAYRIANKEKIAAKKKKYYENNKEEILTKQKNYREENGNEINIQRKEFREKNKDRLNEISRQHYQDNRDERLSKAKEYYQDNKEECSKNSREYYRNNKDKVLESKREYYLKKINSDPLFKIKKNTRTLIGNSIKRGNFSKTSKTQELLGCSFEEFKTYIESQFEPWMSWDNYGKYNGELNFGWDIDHITPMCSATSEEEILKLNHYTNLQPLCSCTNRDIKKGN